MSVPTALQPPTALGVAMAPLVASAVPLVSAVTLSTPTSATLVTGLTVPITIPLVAQFIRVSVQGKNATVTAAATITLGCYIGATAGTLTTLQGTSVVVAPTGGTTVAVNSVFYIPVTSTNAGTSTNVSIAATASTGNYVLNAAATEPTYLVVDCI